MFGNSSVSGYHQASTIENKAENALLLNVVTSWCDDVRNICGFSNDASHSLYRSQGQNRHETEPLTQPNKKSLWRRTETLTSRNLHAAINVAYRYSAFCIKVAANQVQVTWNVVSQLHSQLYQQYDRYLMFTLNLTV